MAESMADSRADKMVPAGDGWMADESSSSETSPSPVSSPRDDELRVLLHAASKQGAFDELERLGIEVERRRLGSRPYLLLIDQTECDYEGLWESAYLEDSYLRESEAVRAAKKLCTDLVREFASGAPGYGGCRKYSWTLVEGPCEREVGPPCEGAREIYRCGFTVRANPLERKSPDIVVIGPFAEGELIDRLPEFVEEWRLRMFFWSVGRAVLEGRPRPWPTSE
jgi:hypothetical protein